MYVNAFMYDMFDQYVCSMKLETWFIMNLGVLC